jgi:hypothetical protein
VIAACERILPAAAGLEPVLANPNDAKDLVADAQYLHKASTRLLKVFPARRRT